MDPPSTFTKTHENLSESGSKSNKENDANSTIGVNKYAETIHKLNEEILQLNRKLKVYTSQGERQTTEINNLRKNVSSLEFKRHVMTSSKEWLESELDTVSRQLISITVSKKKVDKKLAEMEKSDVSLVETRSGSWVVEESNYKENQEPKAKKISRLTSQRAILARHRLKTSLALAAKQG